MLGLLIWTAYGVTQTQKNELQLLAARALEFDLDMKQYGPEAAKAREMLRTEMVWAHEQFWGEERAKADALNVSYGNMASMNAMLTSLKPANDSQRQLLAAAGQHYAAIGETRLSDVAATGRPRVLAADPDGDLVVVPAVLRLWRAVAGERDHDRGAGARRARRLRAPYS